MKPELGRLCKPYTVRNVISSSNHGSFLKCCCDLTSLFLRFNFLCTQCCIVFTPLHLPHPGRQARNHEHNPDHTDFLLAFFGIRRGEDHGKTKVSLILTQDGVQKTTLVRHNLLTPSTFTTYLFYLPLLNAGTVLRRRPPSTGYSQR